MQINSARELADAVNDQLRLGLTARPWNPYTAGDTFWWLVPSTDWPAYRYGKLVFSLARDAPRKDLLGLNDALLETDTIFAGFNIEKGYGAGATFVNPSLRRRPGVIVDPKWLWYEITNGQGLVQFERTLASVASNATIYLYVVSSYVHDPEDPRALHDALMFLCNGVGLQPLLQNLRVPVPVLGAAKTATDFRTLADALRKIDEYHWVDVYVGTHLPKGNVDLADLHARVLSHFDMWLK